MHLNAVPFLFAASTVSAFHLGAGKLPPNCDANPDGSYTFTLVTKQQPGQKGIDVGGRYPEFRRIHSGMALIGLSKTKPVRSNMALFDGWVRFRNQDDSYWDLESGLQMRSPGGDFIPMLAGGETSRFNHFQIGGDGTLKVKNTSNNTETDSWVTWVACEPGEPLQDNHGIFDPTLEWTNRNLDPSHFGGMCNRITLEIELCDSFAPPTQGSPECL